MNTETRTGLVAEALNHFRQEAGKAVIGQTELLDLGLLTVLCGGHALVEGVPGLAKTLFVKVLAAVLDAPWQRVQGTPDLLPADLLGGNVLVPGEGRFRFQPGPVFTEVLLVDEINRMPPRTQAALLEAMEERQVTLDGELHRLRGGFVVFATQNPVEFEGTYPLPEAQLDRFLVRLGVEYPPEAEELAIVARESAGSVMRRLGELALAPFPAGMLAAARAEVLAVRAEPAAVAYATAVARRTRQWPAIALGASPRAAIALLTFARALAARDGRDHVLPDDIKAAAPAVLTHRLQVRPEAQLEGVSAAAAVREVLAAVEIPR